MELKVRGKSVSRFAAGSLIRKQEMNGLYVHGENFYIITLAYTAN